ncbi:MAG: hypothetical protein NC910_03805 [Candidatus Omnitrophica bacterium]|nr:hypothetical protein [Candidatus Omnitrophota bacterium]
MGKILFFLMGAVPFIFSSACLAVSDSERTLSGVSQGQPPSYVAGQAIVRFREGTSQVEVDRLAAHLGASPKRLTDRWEVYLFEFSAQKPVGEMVKNLKNSRFVEHAEPNYVMDSEVDNFPWH